MHSIDNGYSKEKKKENWQMIAKYLKEINDLYLFKQNKEFVKLDNLELLVENKENEVLIFLIKLFQELTNRRLSIVEATKMQTDVDNVNKSFLLKDNGEVELLRKENEILDKKSEELQKSLKTNNNSILTLYKSTNVVMKGEMKLISNNVTNLDSKNFKINIFEAKESESPTKLLRQVKTQPAIESVKVMRSKQEESPSANNYQQLLIAENHSDAENVVVKVKNPFEMLEEVLSKKMQSDYKDEFEKIKFESKFLYDFFKHVNLISPELLQTVLNEINNMVQEFFNILSEQTNEYVNLFVMIFDAYINKEITEERKFKILHEAIGDFFIKSLKNKSEEMFFIFKNVFLAKIFETMSNLEYKDRLMYFCQLIYKILDPIESQQVDLFKLAKDNITHEVVLYSTFSNFHDLIATYSDNLIDACLFYILNGLIHINLDIRYHSLYILSKYVNLNINFFHNFERKLEKLSRRESDRENCLLIIKMACLALKKASKTKRESVVVGLAASRKSAGFNSDKFEEDNNSLNSSVDMCNKIISNIMKRFTGDSLFMLLSILNISEFLYENTDLYKLFLSCLFKCQDNLHKYIFYDEPLDENVNYLLRYTPCRNELQLVKYKDWNVAQMFKAFDLLLKDNNANELTHRDYAFINFLTRNGLNVLHSEIFKNNFRFSKLLIKDIKVFEKCHNSLNILETFLFCEPISKHIFDECFDDLQVVFKEIMEDSQDKKVREAVVSVFKNWIANSSSILKDGLKKLLEILNTNL